MLAQQPRSNASSGARSKQTDTTLLTVGHLKDELRLFIESHLESALEKMGKQICEQTCAELREVGKALCERSPKNNSMGPFQAPRASRQIPQVSSNSSPLSVTQLSSLTKPKPKPKRALSNPFGRRSIFLPLHKQRSSLQSAISAGSSRVSTLSVINPIDDHPERDATVHSAVADDNPCGLESEALLPAALIRESSEPSQPRAARRSYFMYENDENQAGDQKDMTPPCWYERLQYLAMAIVTSTNFDIFFAIMIFLNVVVIGVETDLRAAYMYGVSVDAALDESSHSNWQFTLLHAVNSIFCVLFSVELVLRFIAFGSLFFDRQFILWNVLDLIVCIFQILEEVARCSNAFRMPVNTSVFRILRMLRMVRISRMVRLLEMFRTVMSSIMSSLLSLAGTVWLLLLFLFGVSVFITQIVIDAGETPNADGIRYWYGRLGRTYLTMFESIFGGVSWDEPAALLISDISPWLGVFYSVFVSFCSLSLLNMATGVFVDNAMKRAQLDNDTNTAVHISDLFFNHQGEVAEAREITYEEFCSKIDTPDMQEYFHEINVDPSQAKLLYKLLDADESGSVDAEEIINGLMRIRGNAKALELQLLLYETTRMYEMIAEFQDWAENSISKVCGALHINLDSAVKAGVHSTRNKRQVKVLDQIDDDDESNASIASGSNDS